MANAVGFVDFKRRGELHLCMAFLQWSFNVVKFPEDLNRGGKMVRVMLTSTHRRWMIVLVLILVSATAQMVSADSIADHVVISEIQADSRSSIDDEWVELYNPTDSDINLSGYRIERYTGGGSYTTYKFDDTDEIEIKTTKIIPSHGFYLIVEDSASDELLNMADALFLKTFELNTDDVICFGTNRMGSPEDSDTVDWVGFGSGAYDSEGDKPAPNPPSGKSIQRKVNDTINESTIYGPAWDSDDNSADFFIQDSPNPMNSTTSSADPMPPIPELATLLLVSAGLLILAGCVYTGRRNK